MSRSIYDMRCNTYICSLQERLQRAVESVVTAVDIARKSEW